MAGTDITSLLEAIQKKISAVDSSASTGDLLRLLSAVRQSGSSTVFDFEEDEFPNLLDGADDLQMLAFNRNSKKLYFQKDRWLAKVTPPPPHYQGTNFGYSSGGYTNSPTNGARYDIIDKFPFSADANATDVGDLTLNRSGASGQSSSEHGYSCGGRHMPATPTPSGPLTNIIDKFPFASDGNATDVGDLITVYSYVGGGNSSTTHGYSCGGDGSGPQRNRINKFPFASDANATYTANLTYVRIANAGQSSSENGYVSGAISTATGIDKFPFAADVNATDVGDLTVARAACGQMSATHGYSSGGDPTGTIDKFPFASDDNATDVGDLTVGRGGGAGQSSASFGFISGGWNAPPGQPSFNVIDKFPFANDTNVTDVGDLTFARGAPAGQQY